MTNGICEGWYWSAGSGENIWQCRCGLGGPWACEKFIKDNDRQEAADQAAYDKMVTERMDIGRTLYRTGHTPEACRVAKINARQTQKLEPSENIDRLMGYIDEMRKGVKL